MHYDIIQLLTEAGVLTEMSGAVLHVVKHMGKGNNESDGMIRVSQLSPFDVKEAFIKHEAQQYMRDNNIPIQDRQMYEELRHKFAAEYGKVQISTQELRSKYPNIVYLIKGKDHTVLFCDKPPRFTK